MCHALGSFYYRELSLSFGFIACPPLFCCVPNPFFPLTLHCPSSQMFTLCLLGRPLFLLWWPCPPRASSGASAWVVSRSVQPSILVFPEQNCFHARHGPVPPILSLGRKLSFPCCPSDFRRIISVAVVKVETLKHLNRQVWGSPRAPSWGSPRWESWWSPGGHSRPPLWSAASRTGQSS